MWVHCWVRTTKNTSCDLVTFIHQNKAVEEATKMLLVLSEEHKEHLSFLTKVDVEGEQL